MAGNSSGFTVGGWLVQPDLGQISQGSEVRTLRPQVMELLVYLAGAPGRVVSADEILDVVWDKRVVTSGSVYNCVSELRTALSPDGSASPLIETIPRRGYRLVAPVSDPDVPVDTAPTAGSVVSRGRRAGLIVILAVAGILLAALFRNGSVDTDDVVKLAVLPLDNLSADPSRDDYFTDGMTEALIAALGRTRDLRVISRTTMMQLKGSDLTIPEIASSLGVDVVIEGSVMTAEEGVRVTLQLIDGESDEHLWSASYIRALSDILALQQEMADSVAVELRSRLTGVAQLESDQVSERKRPLPAAYNSYLKGRYQFNQFGEASFRAAIEEYRRAEALDPTFALAPAALAEACMQPLVMLNQILTLDDCRQAALRAIALDDSLAEAHAVLGFAKSMSWDWQGSELDFQRALELNPSSVMAHQWYSLLLRVLMRKEESLREIRRAAELDPLNLFVKTMVGWPLFGQKRYDEALEQYNSVIEINPDFMLAHYNRGLVYLEKGRTEDARVAARRVAELAGSQSQEALLLVAAARAIDGDEEGAQELLDTVEQRYGLFSAAWIAGVYLLMGNEERALQRLEQGFEDRSPDITFGTSEPRFDPLRDHPRFQALRRRMNLP